jgi:hypothetical protein
MLKRALAATVTGVALLAAGVSVGQTPPDSDGPARWSSDLAVMVYTRGWEWIPQVRYSFAGQNITDAPCPGGWGQDHEPSVHEPQQICRFDLTTSEEGKGSRDIVVTFLDSTITNDVEGTRSSQSVDEFSITLTTDVCCDGSPQRYWLRTPSSPLPNGFGFSLDSDDPITGNIIMYVAVPESLFTLEAPNGE